MVGWYRNLRPDKWLANISTAYADYSYYHLPIYKLLSHTKKLTECKGVTKSVTKNKKASIQLACSFVTY